MAVSTPDPAPEAGGETGGAVAPGRHQAFEVDPRRTPLYRVERAIFVTALWSWFRPKVIGKEHVPETGPVILAPVHRSFADFGFAAFCTERKLFFMTKDEMWENKWLGRLLLTVGAFPVHRESADREALQRAEEILRKGQALVLFPEGTRREGPVIEDLMEGAAFLRGAHGCPHRAGRHRGDRPGHAQGQCHPQAPHHSGGDRHRHPGAPPHRRWACVSLRRARGDAETRPGAPGGLRRSQGQDGALLSAPRRLLGGRELGLGQQGPIVGRT